MQIADLSWGASEMSSANDISLSHREASTSTNQLLELYDGYPGLLGDCAVEDCMGF